MRHFELLNGLSRCNVLHLHPVLTGSKLYHGSQALQTLFLWWVSVMLRGHIIFHQTLDPHSRVLPLANFCFCLWHIYVVRVRLVFQRATRSDHWFDFSAVLVCSLSSSILKQLMTLPSKLWGEAKIVRLVVFSFYLPFCQPAMPAEERLWAVGCFFIIDSHVGVFYLSLYADA